MSKVPKTQITEALKHAYFAWPVLFKDDRGLNWSLHIFLHESINGKSLKLYKQKPVKACNHHLPQMWLPSWIAYHALKWVGNNQNEGEKNTWEEYDLS